MRFGLDPWLKRSPGEGSDNLFQHSCLENPMDRRAWWATLHGVAKSWTRLSNKHTDTYVSIYVSVCVLVCRLKSVCVYTVVCACTAESEEELQSPLMKVKEESKKVGLKLNIQKTKIIAFGPDHFCPLSSPSLHEMFPWYL